MGHRRPLRNIYCIGDNVCTDIFGANLYNRYLRDLRGRTSGGAAVASSRSLDHLVGGESADWSGGAENCFSVLVETGVYSRQDGGEGEGAAHSLSLDHSPRDFLPVEEGYQVRGFKHVTISVRKSFYCYCGRYCGCFCCCFCCCCFYYSFCCCWCCWLCCCNIYELFRLYSATQFTRFFPVRLTNLFPFLGADARDHQRSGGGGPHLQEGGVLVDEEI